MKRSWLNVAAVALSALVVVAIADYVAGRISPPPRLREVEDGIRDLERSNPDILVLGSSHARTFHVLGQELKARSGGTRELVAVPLENGKIVPYEWTFDHRLIPLIEERSADGKRVRDRLSQLIVIIEWWDTCAHPSGSVFWNLPARSWTFDDFASDVAEHGLTAYNRNYLQNRVRRALLASSLYQDRSQGALVERIVAKLRELAGMPASDDSYQSKLAVWRNLVEEGRSCILNPEQVGALERIVSKAQQRDLQVGIVLFPRKPDTLTDKAKSTTLAAFSGWAQDFGRKHGVRIFDLTTSSPLLSEDFMADFDHVNAVGNAKFARWALDHDLAFLLQDDHVQRRSANE